MLVASPVSVSASSEFLQHAGQRMRGTGMLRGSLPLPQPVCGCGDARRGPRLHGRLGLQVHLLPGQTFFRLHPEMFSADLVAYLASKQ